MADEAGATGTTGATGKPEEGNRVIRLRQGFVGQVGGVGKSTVCGPHSVRSRGPLEQLSGSYLLTTVAGILVG